MKDQFDKWDRFNRYYKHTGDAMKAKRWVAYEDWAEKRKAPAVAAALRVAANEEVEKSLARINGSASKKTT